MTINLNLDGECTNEICGLTEARTDEILRILAMASKEILENHSTYSFEQEQHPGRAAMHKGKILQRYLADFTDLQECVFIVMIFEKLLDTLEELFIELQVKQML